MKDKTCQRCGARFRPHSRNSAKKRKLCYECNPLLLAEFTKTCEWCGAEFRPAKTVASRTKFCSTKCSHKHHHSIRRYTFVCKGCGREYQTAYSNRDQYCSRECAFENISAWHGIRPSRTIECAHCGKELLAVDAYNSTTCSEECYLAHYSGVCEICGQDFIGKQGQQKTCGSTQCTEEKSRRNSRELFMQRHREAGKVCTCQECGVKFCPLYGTKKRAFCSEECTRKYSNRQSHKYGRNGASRARYHGVPRKYFKRREIFKRDNWRCYICGVDTPKELSGTYEDSAPELDHILPLSKGGAHIPSNVACCCRKCNNEKADMTLEEYLTQIERRRPALRIAALQLGLFP